MSDEPADTVMPTVTIPLQPEVAMAGITAILCPTIMKCALGGWLVAVPGRGVAGRSTLEEAIAFLEEQSFDIFHEPRRETIPAFLEKPREEQDSQIFSRRDEYLRRLALRLNGAAAAVAAFLGVRALGH